MTPAIHAAAMVFLTAAFGPDVDIDELKKGFKSEYYQVNWNAPATFDADSEVEVAFGIGHGFMLEWMRFRPSNDDVEVLEILLEEDRKPYKSKWPPDLAPVKVTSAWMKRDAYAAMLRNIAFVDSARLERNEEVERSKNYFSTNDFWAHVAVSRNKKNIALLDWADYPSSREEANRAKP